MLDKVIGFITGNGHRKWHLNNFIKERAEFTFEVRRKITADANKPSRAGYDTSGYYQGVLSAGFGVGFDSPASARLSFINGIGFNELGSFGAGFGLRMPLEREVVVVPLFADFRIRFTKKHIAPMIVLGLGRCFQPDQEWESTGSIAMAEAGISIKKSGKSSVMLTVGFESYDVLNPIESNLTVNGYGGIPSFSMGPSTERETIRTLTLNLAIAF